jgi:hypothetical protein
MQNQSINQSITWTEYKQWSINQLIIIKTTYLIIQQTNPHQRGKQKLRASMQKTTTLSALRAQSNVNMCDKRKTRLVCSQRHLLGIGIKTLNTKRCMEEKGETLKPSTNA